MHAYLGVNCRKAKLCLFTPWSQWYLRSHTMYQLMFCSRGVVVSRAPPVTQLFSFLVILNQPSQDTKGFYSSQFFFSSSFQCFPVTCSTGIVSIAVSAALGLAVKWEFYLWGFCIKVCMKTLRPPEALLEKQEEGKHKPEWIFNSWRVRAQEMRPGGLSCDCVYFWGDLEPELLTAGWKMQSTDLWSLS